MTETGNRAAIYTREIGAHGVTPLRNSQGKLPAELQKLLKKAAQVPRPFDCVIVATGRVLGLPEEREDIQRRLRKYGIELKVADEDDNDDNDEEAGPD